MKQLELPSSVKERLDILVAALKGALGDDLTSLIVHGSAVRGGFNAGSDVDLVVVLKSGDRKLLDAIAEPLHLARYSARIEAMILVDKEIGRASDVFPIFYADIKRHHVVLHGNDPFEGLEIKDAHLRLRIEQELREVQIRLRRAVTDGRGNNEGLKGVVGRKLKQVRSTLHALLALKKIESGDSLGDVLAKACATWSVDAAPLSKLAEDPTAAHDALVALLTKAIEDADTMGDA